MSRNSFDFLFWRGRALSESLKYKIFKDDLSIVEDKIARAEIKSIREKLKKIAKKELVKHP